jgi:hypothetical protein
MRVREEGRKNKCEQAFFHSRLKSKLCMVLISFLFLSYNSMEWNGSRISYKLP